MRRILSVTAAVLCTMMLWAANAPAASAEPRDADLNAIGENLGDPEAMRSALESDEKTSPSVETKRTQLKQATGFWEFAEQWSSDPGLVLEYLATTMDPDMVQTLVDNTEDKHFTVSETPDGIEVKLEEGPSPADEPGAQPQATYGYDCWEAYAAAAAWALGTGMLCVPAGTYALFCSVGSAVLFPINWNSSCD